MINLSIPQVESGLRPRITVVGVGGAGGNAVNNMIRANLEGVEFVVANTDAQALAGSLAERKLQLGVGITQGLGAGSRPDVGRAAAEEAIEQIDTYLDGSHMVFITAGMGGGTGTGAAPVIARAARERGILTVGVVTKPFHFEGAHRMRTAEQGLQDLQQFVDTLIIIPNQNLFRIATEKTTFADAFKMADEVLHSGVRGVTDLMVMPGLINLDFADIRTVMAEMGKAMMGTGEAEGDRRSLNAAEAAISNPLLDDVSMKGAKGVLINITGGLDMTLYEVDEATNRIRDEVDPDANIIFGSTFDEAMEGRVRVSVVATGIDVDSATMPRPQTPTLTVVGRAAGQGAGPARPATMGSYAPMMEARSAVAPKPAQPVATAQQPVTAQAAAPQQPSIQQPSFQQPQVDGSSALAYENAPEAAAVAGAMAGMAATPEPALQRPAATMQEPVAPRAPERPAMTASQPVPQGTRTAEGSFIPPQPIQAPAKPAASAATVAPKADPFADAAFANAGAQPQRKSGGLFRRVTGLLREEQVRTAPAAAPAAPSPSAPRPETQPAARQPAAQPPLLPGIEATHVPAAKSDDDALEIPAFLRRQAN